MCEAASAECGVLSRGPSSSFRVLALGTLSLAVGVHPFALRRGAATSHFVGFIFLVAFGLALAATVAVTGVPVSAVLAMSLIATVTISSFALGSCWPVVEGKVDVGLGFCLPEEGHLFAVLFPFHLLNGEEQS